MLELTRSTGALTVPLLLAVWSATIVARRLGATSIYSARLPIADQLASAHEPEHAAESAAIPIGGGPAPDPYVAGR